MQACAIEPEVRYFRTSKSDLSRVVRSRPLVKGNEDAGYEGAYLKEYLAKRRRDKEFRNKQKKTLQANRLENIEKTRESQRQAFNRCKESTK